MAKLTALILIGEVLVRTSALESVQPSKPDGDGNSGFICIGYSGAHYTEYCKPESKKANESDETRIEASKKLAADRIAEISALIDKSQPDIS